MQRTKILATLGPASNSPEMIGRLIDAGANVFRVNFSHGKLEEHVETIARIRQVADEKQAIVAILGDLSGPKIRCGEIENGPIDLVEGEAIRLIMEPTWLGSKDAIGVKYIDLINEVEEGHRISMNDGAVVLRVQEKQEIGASGHPEILTTIERPGPINSSKGINCPDSSLSANPLTDYDRDCISFACKQGLDFLALSFVRRAEDIREAKAAIRQERSDIPLIAKIERHEAIEGIEEIVEVADGIMVARGDLGVEIPLEKVPAVQKRIIRLANLWGRPVIVATQMLESMTDNHRPTRAEVSDVANAIFDGADAVMLSGETATGRYPIEAVRMMASIAASAEQEYTFGPGFDFEKDPHRNDVSEAMARAAAIISGRLACSAIICKTRFGSTPRLISRLRPEAHLLTFTPSRTQARRLCIVWGVRAYHAPSDDSSGKADAGNHNAGPLLNELGLALRKQLVSSGERVVLISGLSLDDPETANMMRVLEL